MDISMLIFKESSRITEYLEATNPSELREENRVFSRNFNLKPYIIDKLHS